MVDANASHEPVKPQLVAKINREYPGVGVDIVGFEKEVSDVSKSPVLAAAEVVINCLRLKSITQQFDE